MAIAQDLDFDAFKFAFSTRWLTVRLEAIGNLLTFSAAIFVLLADGITAGDVGLIITYALTISQGRITDFCNLVHILAEFWLKYATLDFKRIIDRTFVIESGRLKQKY